MRINQNTNELLAARRELADLDKKRENILLRIQALENEIHQVKDSAVLLSDSFSAEQKISIFISLFKGREDVYAQRFESKKTGKSGYQPACGNEWNWNYRWRKKKSKWNN